MKIEITGESLKKLMPLWLWIGCWLSAYGATEAHTGHGGLDERFNI